MTHRSLRGALSGRGFMLFPAAAFAVHQLRYELAYGARTDAALSAQGHGYLSSLAPWLAVLVAIAFGSFLVRLARVSTGRASRTPSRAFGQLALVASLGLLGAYSVQEWLEGIFAAGHPAGLEGVFGHGGWWAVPLSVGFGLLLALLLRLAAAVLDAAVEPPTPVLAACAQLLRPAGLLAVRRAPLAGRSAGRAPPEVLPVPAR